MNKHKAATPEQIRRPLTGAEYLEQLRDGREAWICGERVQDVTAHPAFRNQARMVARMYDALHDPKTKDQLTCETDTGSGGYTHRFFRASRTVDELVAARDAIAAWQRIGYGWMGRSPDFMACFTGMLGANAEFFSPYQANAQRWYRETQERVLPVNHALANPPVDRRRPPDEVPDVYVHVAKETAAGLVLRGAKSITTNSVLTTHSLVASDGARFIKNKAFALICLVPMSAPGIKLICRPSYELQSAFMGSPFDYPLSSRFDENDATFILDDVLVPWENVLAYGDLDKCNSYMYGTGLYHRVGLQTCTRLAVKLDLLCGLVIKAVEATGVDQFRGVQVNVGEILNWRHLMWALSDAMARTVTPHHGAVIPNLDHMMAFRMMMSTAYPKIREIVQNIIASGLIFQPSSAQDFKTPELRPYLDKYMRSSTGDGSAVERIKLMKMLWDAIGTEFAGRNELYERNNFGNHEVVRMHPLFEGMDNGLVNGLKSFVDSCMADYDLDGWTAPDLINGDNLQTYRRYSQTLGNNAADARTTATTADVGTAEVPAPSVVEADDRGAPSLSVWTDTGSAYPVDKTTAQLFEEQVARRPLATAVVFGTQTLTYQELNDRANQLANHLLSHGLVGTQGQGSATTTDCFVGICMERSLDLVVAMLGILKAGAAYVPLDPSYPPSRLQLMVRDAGMSTILAHRESIANPTEWEGRKVVYLDADWQTIHLSSSGNPQPSARPQQIAYAVYTSGSTGKPKGVVVPQRAIHRLVLQTNYVQLTAADRIAQASNSSFDAITFEVWGALLHGACLVGIPKETLLSAELLTKALLEQHISILFVTTALFNQLVSQNPTIFQSLRVVLFGGEQVDPKWVRTVLLAGPPKELLHVYGPTECTTFSTWHRVTQVEMEAVTIPIGQPLANTTAYLLDSSLHAVPIGESGELYIGGDGLALGYLHRPELTAERFIDNPFGPGKLYKTGDICRAHADREIIFLGRADHQVKVRGFRIELGEIEACLAAHRDVRAATVVLQEQQPGDKRLIAYVVTGQSASELRSYLQDRLPFYMIPASFVMLEAMPLTSNGKVDRAALSALSSPIPAPVADVQSLPRSDVEEVMSSIWCGVLRRDAVGIHETFMNLGGHSLLAAEVIAKIQHIFQIQIPFRSFLGDPTVAGLSEILVAQEHSPGQAQKLARLHKKLQKMKSVAGQA